MLIIDMSFLPPTLKFYSFLSFIERVGQVRSAFTPRQTRYQYVQYRKNHHRKIPLDKSFPGLPPSSLGPPPADELLPDMTQSGLIVGVVGGFVLLGVLRYCIIWYRRRKVDSFHPIQAQPKSEDGISRPKPQPGEPKS